MSDGSSGPDLISNMPLCFTGIIFLVNVDLLVNGLSCAEIKSRGSGAALTPEEIGSLVDVDPGHLGECIVFLGKDPLTAEQAATIWFSLLQVYGSGGNIPEESLQQLGWVVNGISTEHFANLSLTDVDTIAAFGKCSSLTAGQLEALNSAVFEQWSSKDVEDLTSYDLATLRQILCAFNSTMIQRIHPDAYKDAAQELSTLVNCSTEVMQGLANLAMSPLAFGDPKLWTSLQVATVGCVISGLPSIRLISAHAMEGLTKDVMACLPPSLLQAMSDDQITNLSPSAASSLSSQQMAALYDSQKYALKQGIKGLSATQPASASSPARSSQFNYILYTYIIYLAIK